MNIVSSERTYGVIEQNPHTSHNGRKLLAGVALLTTGIISGIGGIVEFATPPHEVASTIESVPANGNGIDIASQALADLGLDAENFNTVHIGQDLSEDLGQLEPGEQVIVHELKSPLLGRTLFSAEPYSSTKEDVIPAIITH